MSELDNLEQFRTQGAIEELHLIRSATRDEETKDFIDIRLIELTGQQQIRLVASPERVIQVCEDYYFIKPNKGFKCRSEELVRCRTAAAWIMRKYLSMSVVAVGEALHKDHSTISVSVNNMEYRTGPRAKMKFLSEIQEIISLIKGRG